MPHNVTFHLDLHCLLIIPTQCFYHFFSAILIGPLAKLNPLYTLIKTHVYEYLISVLISQFKDSAYDKELYIKTSNTVIVVSEMFKYS